MRGEAARSPWSGPVAAIHETVIRECHSRVSDPVRPGRAGRAAGRGAWPCGVWRLGDRVLDCQPMGYAGVDHRPL